MAGKKGNGAGVKLRSQIWFDNPDDPHMSAMYIERYMNYGLSREELQSGKPIIGIAQTGSDLSPCNRHHMQLAERVREGIRAAGGIAGFAKGGADVKLAQDGADATILTYTAKADVGGKIAQLGSRLIQSTSKKLAGQFFSEFNKVVSAK